MTFCVECCRLASRAIGSLLGMHGLGIQKTSCSLWSAPKLPGNNQKEFNASVSASLRGYCSYKNWVVEKEDKRSYAALGEDQHPSGRSRVTSLRKSESICTYSALSALLYHLSRPVVVGKRQSIDASTKTDGLRTRESALRGQQGGGKRHQTGSVTRLPGCAPTAWGTN
jgi:hypothetical protein